MVRASIGSDAASFGFEFIQLRLNLLELLFVLLCDRDGFLNDNIHLFYLLYLLCQSPYLLVFGLYQSKLLINCFGIFDKLLCIFLQLLRLQRHRLLLVLHRLILSFDQSLKLGYFVLLSARSIRSNFVNYLFIFAIMVVLR